MVLDVQIDRPSHGFAGRAPDTTSTAALCRPRTSPPAASAASSAASSRPASEPRLRSNAGPITCQTASERSVLPWALQPSPWAWPKAGMHSAPEWLATHPWLRRPQRATRVLLDKSAASAGASPAESRSSPFGPYGSR